MRYRKPKAFLSYRHEERRGDAGADSYNQQHRAWVLGFAEAMAFWNVDVIYDGRLQSMFRPITRTDPNIVPFMGEVSLLCMHVSQAFVPIITRGYLERISDLSDSGDRVHGVVTQEWDMALEFFAAGQLELVPIIREWPVGSLSHPPEPIMEENSWDYRLLVPEREEVELLTQQLHSAYDVERPPIDLTFHDWIKLYLKWSMLLQEVSLEEGIEIGGHLLKVIIESPQDPPAWQYVDEWGCDFDRPKRFLAHCSQLRAEGAFPETGQSRDLEQVMRALREGGMQTVYNPNPTPVDPEVERAAEDKASQLAQSVTRAVLEKTKRTISFDAPHPPEALQGLYFGPTNLDYSHRHPAELKHMREPPELIMGSALSPKPGFWARLFQQDKG